MSGIGGILGGLVKSIPVIGPMVEPLADAAGKVASAVIPGLPGFGEDGSASAADGAASPFSSKTMPGIEF